MLIAALSALVLQVAPAQYDAAFSCDCRPQATETSGILTTRTKDDGDFDFDYPNAGAATLATVLRGARKVVADSPGLQMASKWQSSVRVLIEDQTLVVPVGVSVTHAENGLATIEAHGELNATPVRLQIGTVPVSITLDLVEHVKLGRSADEPPSLASLVENVVDSFASGMNARAFQAAVKCRLTAK